VDAVVRDQPLTIINAHPINASSTATDPCRLAQYKQIFEDLPGDGPNLLGGDFNMDPYRFPDLFPSAEYWHTVVGEDEPFDAHNADDPEQPTTTWLDVATLDYVLSDFGTGTCEVLGVTDGTSRIDGSMEMMDHRAVWCTISQ
jgi:endonuclease/exonuclease/phosphatase family metal-dependent hydrolase